MKLKYRVGAAALTLIFCLSVAPVVAAKANRDRDRIRIEPPEQIIRIVKRIKNILNRPSTQEDLPQPPVP